MLYYLGIDIGTTSAKSVAFSEAGEILASYSCNYGIHHLCPDWSEQDPEEIFQAVITSSNKIISSLSASPVLVSFSSAMHGLLVIDKDGAPLTRLIIWADNRACDIAENLKTSGWGREIYEITGVPLHAMSPLCKIKWMKENDPSTFNKAHKFISIKEYIFHKLFHEYIVDTSIASATGLLNLKTLSWDEKILDFAEISPSFLSQVVSTKTKRTFNRSSVSEDAKHWLVNDGTPFIIGSSDGALANLGTGAMESCSLAISIGTSSAARIVVADVETDIKMRTFCYHIKDKLYIVGGASNNGAVTFQWLKENLLETKESFEKLFEEAETVKPGSDDLIFMPYILGERAPIWNSKARGSFLGLSINHTKAHLIRACMEGVIYGVYSITKILLENRIITEIYATGGFVQSPTWVQMLADLCNIKILVSGALESSALGAVIIGLEALEIEPIEPKKILCTYEPNLLHHEVYIKSFEKFERLYELLKDELANEPVLKMEMQLD